MGFFYGWVFCCWSFLCSLGFFCYWGLLLYKSVPYDLSVATNKLKNSNFSISPYENVAQRAWPIRRQQPVFKPLNKAKTFICAHPKIKEFDKILLSSSLSISSFGARWKILIASPWTSGDRCKPDPLTMCNPHLCSLFCTAKSLNMKNKTRKILVFWKMDVYTYICQCWFVTKWVGTSNICRNKKSLHPTLFWFLFCLFMFLFVVGPHY